MFSDYGHVWPGVHPYSSFNTECWAGGSGNAYAGQPISSVVFYAAGSTTASPFQFCIEGFAPGTSVDDAP